MADQESTTPHRASMDSSLGTLVVRPPDGSETITAPHALTHAQTVTLQLRAELQRLGADRDLAMRVVPWNDITGRPTIHIPTLPLDVAERVLAALTQAETAS